MWSGVGAKIRTVDTLLTSSTVPLTKWAVNSTAAVEDPASLDTTRDRGYFPVGVL